MNLSEKALKKEMATEEDLRDAQIQKTRAETELAQEQFRELQRGSHIWRRVSQGVGIGIVLALAGMALFGPIKDTIEAESKLATLNATIAQRTIAELQQRLDARQKQLEAQEARYTEDLTQLANDLKKANEARDAAIARSKDLAKREQDLAKKYGRLAAQQQNNEDLLAQAREAATRAEQLENEIANLRVEAEAALAKTAQVQAKVDVRPLSGYAIPVGGDRAGAVTERLDNLGLSPPLSMIGHVLCVGEGESSVHYYSKDAERAARLLATALDETIPAAELRFNEDGGNSTWITVCAY